MNTPSGSRHGPDFEPAFVSMEKPVHPEKAPATKHLQLAPPSPLGSPIAGDSASLCSPIGEKPAIPGKPGSNLAEKGPGSARNSPAPEPKVQTGESVSRAESECTPEYSEIALQIEKEKTRQTELKCDLAKLVMEIMKSADTNGMTPELLRRMFVADEPVDYKQYLHYVRAQMHCAGGPAPDGLKPETPSPRLPALPSSVTYGTLASMSGVNSAMGSQSSHSRSSSGRSLHPLTCASVNERAERSEKAEGGSTRAPLQTPDRAVHDRPMPMYSQQVFPVFYTLADPPVYPPAASASSSAPAPAPASTSASHQKPSNAQHASTANPAPQGASGQAKSDDGLGLPYNTHKYPSAFHSLPQFRPSNQASPGSSAAHSPQPQVTALPHPQLQPPNQAPSAGLQHAQQQAHIFQAGSMPPHGLHATVMQTAGASAQHAAGAPHGQPQPVYYMNALPPLSAPMVPSQYYMPNNMMPWKLVPAPAEKRREEEEPHVTKRTKTGKNGLNFMITTPKNPPARKYNK